MKAYRDARTGYEVCQYTEDSARNAKLYFTTENFSADDRYFFFERTEAPETAQHGPQLHFTVPRMVGATDTRAKLCAWRTRIMALSPCIGRKTTA